MSSSTEPKYHREIPNSYKLTDFLLLVKLFVCPSPVVSVLSRLVNCYSYSIVSYLIMILLLLYIIMQLHSCHFSLFSLCCMLRILLYLCITLPFSKLPSVNFPCHVAKMKSLENENMTHIVLINWVKFYFVKFWDWSLITGSFYLAIRLFALDFYEVIVDEADDAAEFQINYHPIEIESEQSNCFNWIRTEIIAKKRFPMISLRII